MRLKIAYSKIKQWKLVLIDNGTHQRETLSERPIRQPLIWHFHCILTWISVGQLLLSRSESVTKSLTGTPEKYDDNHSVKKITLQKAKHKTMLNLKLLNNYEKRCQFRYNQYQRINNVNRLRISTISLSTLKTSGVLSVIYPKVLAFISVVLYVNMHWSFYQGHALLRWS